MAKQSLFWRMMEVEKNVARRVNAATVLGDGQVILRNHNATFMGYSTPWGAIDNQPNSTPLEAFFLIEKARHFNLVPIKPREVNEFLWSEQ
jgi:hypothetical protein